MTESPGDASDSQVRSDRAQLFGGVIYSVGENLFGLRPVGGDSDTFDPTRVGLDHVSFGVGSRDDLVQIESKLSEHGIEHGEVTDLADAGVAILSFQDPDDVNLELVARALS
ncbi:MAG: hypothetical protein WKF83_04880 [Nocardioidaceae bacterium]